MTRRYVLHRAKKRGKNCFQPGFSLLELLISVAILTLLMMAASQIFARSFGNYRSIQNVENNVSDAQFLMNSLAKELRTSTITAPISSGWTQSIKFFENSKSECVQYRFNSANRTVEVARSASGSSFSSCDNTNNLSNFEKVGGGNVTGAFYSVPSKNSDPLRVGRVTVILEIRNRNSDPAVLQTTTSLRDYGYIGLLE